MKLGWQAHFGDEFYMGAHRLHLWRESGDMIEVARGELTVSRHDPALMEEGSGLLLPRGAYAAIVEAIHPPAHQAELRRLEEALALERARVDRALARRLTKGTQ